VDWVYSEPINPLGNFWRRQVVFKEDKVWYVVDEYWED
jgi:hypothetical protein